MKDLRKLSEYVIRIILYHGNKDKGSMECDQSQLKHYTIFTLNIEAP